MRLRAACIAVAFVMAAASPVTGRADSAGDGGGAAAANPIDCVRSGLAARQAVVRIPKGTYELDAREGVYFDIRGVRDVVIDFQGSRLNGVRRTRMFGLTDATNVVIRNVTVDYARLPFTQGVIEEVDVETNWVVRTGPDNYRVTGGKDRRGAVGDYCVWSIQDANNVRDAFGLSQCVGCRLENITVYSTPMGCAFSEDSCASNAYVNCRLVRCPEKVSATSDTSVPQVMAGNMFELNLPNAGVKTTVSQFRCGERLWYNASHGTLFQHCRAFCSRFRTSGARTPGSTPRPSATPNRTRTSFSRLSSSA